MLSAKSVVRFEFKTFGSKTELQKRLKAAPLGDNANDGDDDGDDKGRVDEGNDDDHHESSEEDNVVPHPGRAARGRFRNLA